MDAVHVGWISILPPIIAIVLAIITKEVIFSLTAGVFSGAIIYSIAVHLNPIVGPVSVTFDIIAEKADLNIIIFCFLLGALVFIINASGGANAYGRWASKVIKTKRSSMLITGFLGCLIFLDDYFNCLTVGTVMKPVTDRHNVSRAKLAYIIDSTAAPICIIAPISSWAAAVGNYLKTTGAFESDFKAFISAIPYNFYAILSLIMVFFVATTSFDFGPMARFERESQNKAMSSEPETVTGTVLRGRVFDMIIPILVLIITAITGMLYNGGYWSGVPELHSITAALGNSSAAKALVWGSFAGLLSCMLLYIPRNIMTFKEFMNNITLGMQKMVPSACILLLAWAIGGICRDLLSTPEFVRSFFVSSGIPGLLLPVIVFVLAAFLSFATGTSWGTFGILIPIIIPVAQSVCPELLMASLGATLAGSIFGDHCSPISDTTILSSAGADVNHLDHVSSQMVYSLTVAFTCIIGYLIIGLTKGNVILSLSVSIIVLIASIVILHKLDTRKSILPISASSAESR